MSATPPSTSTTPGQTLLLSRERLRAALQATSSNTPSGSASNGAPAADAPTPSPGAALLAAVLRQWWAKHPAHQAATLAAQTARELTLPVAQKHPVVLVAGAFAVGAGLVALRPWRLLSGAALLGRMAPAVLRLALQRPRR